METPMGLRIKNAVFRPIVAAVELVGKIAKKVAELCLQFNTCYDLTLEVVHPDGCACSEADEPP